MEPGRGFRVLYITNISSSIRNVYRYPVFGVPWVMTWGRSGFDVDHKTRGACRGAEYLVNPTAPKIVANDDNYALAA